MSSGKALLVGVLLSSAVLARAETRLFLRSEPGDYVGAGQVKAFSSPDGAFVASSDRSSVLVFFSVSNDPGTFWTLSFRAPFPGSLVPGTYEAPLGGSLDVSGEGRGCGGGVGRFVVHELVRGLRGDVLSFAADFEQHCPGYIAILYGSIRIRSGNPTCAGAPSGTTCDDHDPCTAGDQCIGGTCVGTDVVTATCPTPTTCHLPAICDPANAACATPRAPDGSPCGASPGDVCIQAVCTSCGSIDTCEEVRVAGGGCFVLDKPPGASCDDGDPCTVNERCDFNGTCGQGTTVDCDDRNPCSTDTCDGRGGCSHDPIPGCFGLGIRAVGRASGSGSISGQSVTCTSPRCEQVGPGALVLNPDGTYRSPSTTTGGIGCPSSSVPFPDEVGIVRRGRKGRLILRPSNLAEIRQALQQCTGRRISLHLRERMKLSPDGQSLTGTVRARATVYDQIPVNITVVGRVVGRLGTAAALPPLRTGRFCSEIRVRCVAH